MLRIITYVERVAGNTPMGAMRAFGLVIGRVERRRDGLDQWPFSVGLRVRTSRSAAVPAGPWLGAVCHVRAPGFTERESRNTLKALVLRRNTADSSRVSIAPSSHNPPTRSTVAIWGTQRQKRPRKRYMWGSPKALSPYRLCTLAGLDFQAPEARLACTPCQSTV
jgi:hypothetical protein